MLVNVKVTGGLRMLQSSSEPPFPAHNYSK